MKIKIVNKSPFPLPKYETEGSVGMDLKANIPEGEITIPALLKKDITRNGMWEGPVTESPTENRRLIKTGIHIQLPQGYEAQVRARSGLALKRGLTTLNGIGTIDADYRGDIGVILVNTGVNAQVIKHGDRIAQLVINKPEIIEWAQRTELNETERGDGGFGHTGTS